MLCSRPFIPAELICMQLALLCMASFALAATACCKSTVKCCITSLRSTFLWIRIKNLKKGLTGHNEVIPSFLSPLCQENDPWNQMFLHHPSGWRNVDEIFDALQQWALMRLRLNTCLSFLQTAPCRTVSLITETVVFCVPQTAPRLDIHQTCEILSGDSATVMTFTMFSSTTVGRASFI